METVLNLLLIRFGLIVGGLVVIALIVFTVAVSLRRRGRLHDARRYAEPLARAVAQRLDDRDDIRLRRGSTTRNLSDEVARAIARHLADGNRRTGDR